MIGGTIILILLVAWLAPPGGAEAPSVTLFPQLCAFAEVGWSSKEARDWTDFVARLKVYGRRLDEIGINYRRDAAVWQNIE